MNERKNVQMEIPAEKGVGARVRYSGRDWTVDQVDAGDTVAEGHALGLHLEGGPWVHPAAVELVTPAPAPATPPA